MEKLRESIRKISGLGIFAPVVILSVIEICGRYNVDEVVPTPEFRD